MAPNKSDPSDKHADFCSDGQRPNLICIGIIDAHTHFAQVRVIAPLWRATIEQAQGGTIPEQERLDYVETPDGNIGDWLESR